MYQIRFDARTRTLRITLSGLWTVEVLRGFGAEMMARRQQAGDGDFDVLSDSRAFPVQTNDVAQAFTATMNAPIPGLRRIAVVVGSMLNKLQAGRVFTAPHIRVFTDMAAAEAWLAEGRDSSPAA